MKSTFSIAYPAYQKKIQIKSKAQRSALAVLISLSSIFSFCPWSSLWAAPQSEKVGQVISVTGKVLMRNEGGNTTQMALLKAGDAIQVGSIINTGSTGAAKLMFTDKTIIDLGASSLFKVNEYILNHGSDRKVDLAVDYGKVRASVNRPVNEKEGNFTIRTKAATMGVRGTEFVVSAPVNLAQGEPTQSQSDQTQLTVVKGRVNVSSSQGGSSSVVGAGMQYFQPAQGQAQIAQLSTQQIDQVRQSAVQKDMTFLQAISIDANSARESASRENERTKAKAQVQQGSSSSADESDSNKPLASVAENVISEVQTQVRSGKIPTSDIQFPGVFGEAGTLPHPPQILQGRPVPLQVNFNP